MQTEFLPPSGCVTLDKLPIVSVQEAGHDGCQGPSQQGTAPVKAMTHPVPLFPASTDRQLSKQVGVKLKHLQGAQGKGAQVDWTEGSQQRAVSGTMQRTHLGR